MKFLDLQQKINTNAFTLLDVEKHFPDEHEQVIKTQLSRFSKKGLLAQIKRGIYCFDKTEVDELALANKLYQPSYISLETALNYYGIIPDVAQTITSINLTTTKTFNTEFGTFSYAKIKQPLFFGYTKITSPRSFEYIAIAQPEKALLDYFHIRSIKQTEELRLELSVIDKDRLNSYAKTFPDIVKKIKL